MGEADDPDKYATHFSAFIAADIGCDDLEELYKKVHTSIKEDPTAKPTDKKVPELTQDLKALPAMSSSLTVKATPSSSAATSAPSSSLKTASSSSRHTLLPRSLR